VLKSTAIVGLALLMTACASEPRREFRRGRGGPPPGAAMGSRRLFLSPSGEPFRGADGLTRWFEGADTDHDGALTPAEFQADAVRFFKVLDANHDGVVDGLEIHAYEETIAPEVAANDFDRPQGAEASERPERSGGAGRGGGRGRRGGGGGHGTGGMASGGGARGGGREGAARYSLINEPEPVANADENVDGQVSLTEWAHATTRRFTALDKAKSGRLTLDVLRGKVPPPRR